MPTTHCTGIDEAGYGPLIGPLVVVAIHAEGDDEPSVHAALRAAVPRLRDSKRVHRSDDLAPLERIALPALAWATGFQPTTAADVFALLGEGPEDRDLPWMAGASELRLPCAARTIEEWDPSEVRPAGVAGALIHPRALNDAAARSCNRAARLLVDVARCLRALPVATRPCRVVCDRLGGRRYYAPLLADAWPSVVLTDRSEDADGSVYRGTGSGHAHIAAFLTGGESRSPLTAAASCIGKYARELHMRLLNDYWSTRLRTLRPTAGYGRDGKRWIFQLGSGLRGAYGYDLIRGHNATSHP